MNPKIVGKCIKEFTHHMLPYQGLPEEMQKEFLMEYKIEINDIVPIHVTSTYDNNEYSFYLRYKKITMAKKEFEEHFQIIWEYGCYNTCIRNGIPCKNLGYIEKGSTERTPYLFKSCGIGWEVGREGCFKYEAKWAMINHHLLIKVEQS